MKARIVYDLRTGLKNVVQLTDNLDSSDQVRPNSAQSAHSGKSTAHISSSQAACPVPFPAAK